MKGLSNAGMDFNLLNESGDGEQSGSMITVVPVHDSDHQQLDLTDENEESDRKEPFTEFNGQVIGAVSQIMVHNAETGER